jgi:tetratricopeptide (TPR) repeat protein
MKAYLAHSSEDKQYVDIVAKRLGRIHCEYDVKSFPPGFDFRDIIRKSLDKSKIFVLFASKKSIDSTWVKFEISEAEWKTIHEEIAGSIVIIIDDQTVPKDLPKWMQRCLVVTITNPRSAVHIIQNFMIQLNIVPHTIFVGRETDMAKFATELSPDIEKEPPRVLIIGGLEGIGRRTLGRYAMSNYLSINPGPIFSMEETDAIDSLYLQLVNYTGNLTSRDKLAEAIRSFHELNYPEKGAEIARLLSEINAENIMPIIVDKGTTSTLLDDNTNWYKYEWQTILEGLRQYENTYILFVQPRLPDLTNIPDGIQIPPIARYRLGPLAIDSIELLLREILRREELAATTYQIKEITPYINGYPPAVYLVIGYIRNYGFDLLLADKGVLTAFLARTFEPLLESLRLTRKEGHLLKILASDLPLPFVAIQAIIDCPEAEAVQIVRRLIDANLIVTMDSDYAISPPVQISIRHKLGFMTRSDYSKLALILREKFWAKDEELPKLSIVDAIIHALAYSDLDELNNFKDITLPGQLYKVAMEKYNARDWRGSETLAKKALQLDVNLHGARKILFKALTRQRHWNEARKVLEEIEQLGRRERFYLNGFFEWKTGHAERALDWFRRGWEAGDQSLAILRDSAYCSFISGKMDDAKFYIDQALSRSRNKFVLDLAAQIAIFSDKMPAAEEYLSELQGLDQVFFHNRRGTLRYKQGKYPEALEDVQRAYDGSDYPSIDIMVQRAILMIILDRDQAESEILKIETIMGEHSDIVRGLRCNYHLQQGQWVIADRYWQKIWQKELPAFKELRRAILELKKGDITIPAPERKEAETELSEYTDVVKIPIVNTDIEGPE